jgi:hypothetical protein
MDTRSGRSGGYNLKGPLECAFYKNTERGRMGGRGGLAHECCVCHVDVPSFSAEIVKRPARHAPQEEGAQCSSAQSSPSPSNGLTPQTCAIKRHRRLPQQPLQRSQVANANAPGSPGATQTRSSSCSDPQPQPTRRRACRGNARARLGSLPSVMQSCISSRQARRTRLQTKGGQADRKQQQQAAPSQRRSGQNEVDCGAIGSCRRKAC